MKQPNYKFYPSLLDGFGRFLRVDDEIDGPYNIDENGDYKKSPDQMIAEAKQKLIDSINRVPFESEAADKGTAFNEIVDCLVHNRKPDESSKVKLTSDQETNMIQAEINNRHFLFDLQWCLEVAAYFKGACSQIFTEATIDTKYGIVLLYGYIDEVIKDKVSDIKTTSRYEYLKYEHGFQRHVYPYCLIESGLMENVDSFEYTAFALKGGTSRTPLISGTSFPELYKYDHKKSTDIIRKHCERFIEFLEANRDVITDKKIFGGEKE